MPVYLSLVTVLVLAAGVLVWSQLRLSRLRAEIETWRSRHGALELELARASTQVELVGQLERERADLRERLEYVTAQKSRLETTADRVPSLERQIAALLGEITGLRSTNAGLMAQMKEQAQAHQEKCNPLVFPDHSKVEG